MKKIGIIVCIILFLTLLIFNTKSEGYFFKKENIGIVLTVDNSDAIVQGVSKVGCQHLEVAILTGKYKDAILETNNLLSGSIEYDEFYEPKDKVLIATSLDKETGKINGKEYVKKSL